MKSLSESILDKQSGLYAGTEILGSKTSYKNATGLLKQYSRITELDWFEGSILTDIICGYSNGTGKEQHSAFFNKMESLGLDKRKAYWWNYEVPGKNVIGVYVPKEDDFYGVPELYTIFFLTSGRRVNYIRVDDLSNETGRGDTVIWKDSDRNLDEGLDILNKVISRLK